MPQVIIHSEGGRLAVVVPTSAAQDLVQLARRVTPPGVPFRIIDASELPQDGEYRDAWTADFSQPDGIGIGQEAWLEEQQNAGNNA